MWPWLITYGLVILWLMPGAFVTDTALVLLVAWGVGEAHWWLTGVHSPVHLYIVLDVVSIAFIWRWATGKDWLILAIFPFMWLCYWKLDGVPQWYALLGLTWAQFIIAGPWSYIIGNRTLEGRRGYVGG